MLANCSYLVKARFLIIIGLMLFTSCSTLRRAYENNEITDLTADNIEILNGKYLDEPFFKSNPSHGDLHWYLFDRGYNFKDSIKYIEFKSISPKRILVRSFDGETLVKEKAFKGKIKDGYFVFNKRYLLIPALFMNVYRDRQIRIGKLKNKNLITDYNQVTFGTGLFVFPFFENRKEFNVEFGRLEQ